MRSVEFQKSATADSEWVCIRGFQTVGLKLKLIPGNIDSLHISN